jgi:hypothetical protein
MRRRAHVGVIGTLCVVFVGRKNTRKRKKREESSLSVVEGEE